MVCFGFRVEGLGCIGTLVSMELSEVRMYVKMTMCICGYAYVCICVYVYM